jgi:hypothetical protein
LPTAPTTYTLSGGDGLKTLYAWFKDGAGNVSSTPATDGILLDTTPPVGSIDIEPVTAPGSGVVPPGAVGYWKFDEGSGNTAFDETDNDNDGTINGASWTTGKSGNALNFDGNGDYVEVPASSSLDFNGATQYTFQAWIKSPLTSGESSGLFRQWELGDLDTGVGLWYKASGDSYRIDIKTSSWQVFTINSANIPADTWTHITFTFNAGTLKAYQNGVLLETHTTSGTTLAASGKLRLGAFSYNGLIDEIVIYNRALSESEIQDLYNSY